MSRQVQGELQDVDVDWESEPSSNYKEETKPFHREYDKNIQDYVIKNDIERAKFLLSHGCKGISKNTKPKNVEAGKKLAEIDKETVKLLEDKEKRSKQYEQKIEQQPLSKLKQTDEECKNKMIQVQRRENPQEDKKQSCDEFYIFAEGLVRYYEIQNYEAVIKDLQAKSPNEFKLIKYYKYKIGDQGKWANFINCLQSHPQYAEYRKYLGVNIKQAKKNFQSWIKNQLVDKNQFSVRYIIHISKHLVQDPFYPFWNDKQLNDLQKQSLYQIVYDSPKMLEYKLKLLIPESLLSKNFEVIEKVLEYLVEKQYIKSGQIQQCIKALQSNNDILFYQIASITNYRKKISEFFDEIGQKFFFEQRNIRGNDCPKKLQAQTILKIRKLLHSLNVNFDLYQEIEEKLLNLKVDDLWNVMISPKTRQKIIKEFETDNLFMQYRKYNNNVEVPLEIKVKNQILKTFISLDFKNLNYKQMEQFAQQIVKKRVNLKNSLTPIQVKDFEQRLQKCENVKKFFDDCRRNIAQDSSNLREKFLFIFNDCPELLRYDSIIKIINHVLNTSKVLEIYDFLDISPNQKKYIVDSLIATEQYLKFKSSFGIIQAIRSEKEFEQQVSRKFSDKGKNLFSYYQLYGRFQQKLFGVAAQNLVSLKNLQSRIQQIQDLEQSMKYKSFKKNFAIIFENNKNKAQEQFSIDVRCLLQIRIGCADQLIKTLQQSNYDVQQSIPKDYHDSIKADVGYKDLMKWKNASRANESFFEKIATQMTIDGIFYHPSVIKYSPDERRDLIDGLLANGTDFLTKCDLIRKSQKEQIRKLLGQVTISSQKIIEKVEQPQIEEPEAISPQQICSEIKKLFVGTQFIEKMTVQQIRTFFKEYPFSEDKVNNICSQYNLLMKKKSSFKENLARVKNDLSMRVEQLQKTLSKNPSPISSPTKKQKKDLNITIPETPKEQKNKFFKKEQQPQPVINPVPTPKNKSKEEASKQILDILLQSGSKSEKLNIEVVQAFFRGEFNPEQSAAAFGIQALKKKSFIDLVKNNLEKIKQLSKSLE